TVGAVISQESLFTPSRNVGGRPAKFARLLVERSSLVLDIARRQKFSSCDWFDGSAHQHAVHDDVTADGEAPHGELMFGGNSLRQSVDLAFKLGPFAGGQ